ncbi:MAG: hypothetical protein ACFFB3_13535 [Candidatus Hodarchaeota archaeon]
MLSTIAILSQKRSRQPLALKIAALARKRAKKVCTIFGLSCLQKPDKGTGGGMVELVPPIVKNIGTYPKLDGDLIRSDLDDFLTFYGDGEFAIGWLWPPTGVLNGAELIQWSNSLRTFLQGLAQDGFSYCFFEAEWADRLSFALGWSIFDKRVLVFDPSSAFPMKLNCLPWYGKFILFFTPITSSMEFQPEKWLPKALHGKTIEFVVARSEDQDLPLQTLWKMLQEGLFLPELALRW